MISFIKIRSHSAELGLRLCKITIITVVILTNKFIVVLNKNWRRIAVGAQGDGNGIQLDSMTVTAP